MWYDEPYPTAPLLDETSLKGNREGMNGVDIGDDLLWRDKFGLIAGAGDAGSTPPEPKGLVLGVLSGGFWNRMNRMNRQA